MKVICDNCGKEFEKTARRVKESEKNGWRLFCSKECHSLGKSTKVKCVCAHCGKELLKLPSELKYSKTGNVFCNRSCSASYNNSHFRTGENNPNWKGGSYSNIEYQKVAYRYYKHECAICKFAEFSALEIHHIDENRENNDLDNLIVLCANHHNMIHYGTFKITEEIKANREKQ